MNKTRVEAFSDAVIAIIMTIVILEIKTPQVGVLAGLIENIPYFLSFIVSFIFICIAWYNHHYIMSVTHWFSKKAFWANNFWLFSMAFIPVATAWVSEFWWMRAPVYFYLVVYTVWDFAYFLLTRIIYEDNAVKDPQGAAKLRKSKSYSKATKIIHLCLFAIGYIGIYFYPPIGIGVILSEAVIWYLNVPKEGDRLEC